MKILRVVTIGLILSVIALRFVYIPFISYFMKCSVLYAFSYALEITGYAPFHHLTSSVMGLFLFTLSLSMGLFMASFIYSPIEDIAIAKFRSVIKMKKE